MVMRRRDSKDGLGIFSIAWFLFKDPGGLPTGIGVLDKRAYQLKAFYDEIFWLRCYNVTCF